MTITTSDPRRSPEWTLTCGLRRIGEIIARLNDLEMRRDPIEQFCAGTVEHQTGKFDAKGRLVRMQTVDSMVCKW